MFCSFNVVGIAVAWVLNSSRRSLEWKVRRLYVMLQTVHGRANSHCDCNLYLLSYLSLLFVISIFYSSLYFLPPPPPPKKKKIIPSLGKLLLIPSKPVMGAVTGVVFCWTQPTAMDRQYSHQKLTSTVSAMPTSVEKRLVVVPSVMINFGLTRDVLECISAQGGMDAICSEKRQHLTPHTTIHISNLLLGQTVKSG